MKLNILNTLIISSLAVSSSALADPIPPTAIFAESNDSVRAFSLNSVDHISTAGESETDIDATVITTLAETAADPYSIQVFAYDVQPDHGSDLGSGKYFKLTRVGSEIRDLKLERVPTGLSLSFVAKKLDIWNGDDTNVSSDYRFVFNYKMNSQGKVSNKGVLKSFRMPRQAI